MTIPSTPRKAGPLLGTGAQTSWPFTFKVFAESDIAVTIANSTGVETALVLDTDYSVTLNANQDTSPGGTVTYPISGDPLPSGSVLSIVGDLDYDQPLDLPSGGNFSPIALENELDRLTMQIQQIKEELNRALLVPVTSAAAPSLPFPEANQIIGWDASGENLQNVPLSDLATAVAYGTFRYDTFTGDGSTTQFTLTSDPAAIGNLDVAMDGLTMVPGTDYSLVSGVLTFSVAPSNGAEILARYGQALPITGVVDASAVSYQPAGVGSELTDVETKLRESVSVKDFGAIGDGVADDTAVLQAAIDAASNGSKKLYLPAGTYKTTSGLSFGTPIKIFGDGADVTSETGTIIKPTQSSGIALTFTNASGSFDNGLILEDFAIIGTGSGTAVGLEVNGAVWTNSRIRNVTVQSMGGRGVVVDDCLTANFEHVRAAGCGSDGFRISGSNGIRLYGCMSESNAGYGYHFDNALTAGERNGPLMLACHAEENTGGDAVYMNQYSNPMIQGCWLQVASASNVDRAAIHLDTCTGAMVTGNLLTSNAAWPLFQGVKLNATLFSSIIGNNISGYGAARAIVENATSGRNLGMGNRGDGTQGAAGVTSTSSTGSVFHTHMGTGGTYGQEWTAGYHSFKNTSGTEVMAAGTDTLALGVTLASTNVRLAVKANAGKRVAQFLRSNGDVYCYFDNDNAVAGSPNAADAVLFFNKISSNNRSINAAGTLNASGADYAEYERNNGLTFAKGDVVGFKQDGTLTATFSDAVRFGIKSTDPSYVGGDTWGVGLEGDELEAARQLVDRIAYSGKVPVNVMGATPGGYIIAVNNGGAIAGEFVADPDFAQYKNAVGRVNRILPDGRCEVAVMVH